MAEPTVGVLAATIADLKAKGWITDVVAALLIEANNKDRSAFTELIEAAQEVLDNHLTYKDFGRLYNAVAGICDAE